MKRKEVVTGVGSVLAAVAASSCCWLPLLLLAAGAGATAVGAVTRAIDTFRPLFAAVAVGFLGAAWYFTYFRRSARFAAGSGESCGDGEPRWCSEAEGGTSVEEECCAAKPSRETAEAVCSCCRWKGKRVPASTVRALVRPDLQEQVREGGYILCLNPGCAQVYTGPAGARSFVKADLTVRVGYKEAEGPHLVCYCFEHSVEDIEEELRSTGKTTIPERIRIKVKEGFCRCEIKNPQGTCCLGNVDRAVKEAESRISEGMELKVAPVVQCAPPPALEENHEDCCSLPRRPGAVSTLGRLNRVNKVLLPIFTLLILGMVFFPHQVFAFLIPKEEAAVSAPSGVGLKTVILHVPGMT